MPTRVRAINITYEPNNGTWVLLKDDSHYEYRTFTEVLIALAKYKWLEDLA